MNKLTRYNLGEIYRIYSSDKHNVVCTDYDVAELEAKYAQLLEAAEKVAERFDTDMVERLFFINKVKAFGLAMEVENLRAAIAKAKKEQP